jgi:hypothetical protein
MQAALMPHIPVIMDAVWQIKVIPMQPTSAPADGQMRSYAN